MRTASAFLLVVAIAALAHAGTPKLVSTQELDDMIKKGGASVVDLRSDLPEYLKGHIPDASYLHYETLRISKSGVPAAMLSGESYAALFSRLGLTMEKPVVIYSAGDANNFYATFMAWLLTGFGHQSVHLLDGGYEKWMKEGRTIAKQYPKVQMSSFPSQSFNLHVVSLDAVKRAVEKKDALLVDARPLDQFEGRAGAQMRLGHIPGAIHHFWASDLMQTDNGKVWKPTDQVRESYEKQGVTADKNIIVYCNTGTEATHLYFALRNLLGYSKVSVYVPSYTEWAAIEDLPVERAASGQ
ncbi:MAG: sulfurtransferase [Ignavibacteriae bacterium]|nr:sulfurtransferase [Ignavibacteriota bacterium]